MNKNLALLAVLIAIVGCSSSSTTAGGVSAEGPTDIKLVGKVGDTYTYSMKSKIEAVGSDKGTIEFSADMTEKLAKVEGGTFEWDTSFKDVTARADGVMTGADAAFKMLEGMTMVSVQDERGAVKSVRLGETEIPNQGSSNVVLPPKGTKAGGTWTSQLDLSGQSVDIVYKLEGFETIDGVLQAKITGSYPDSKVAKSIEPTVFYVDTTNGKMVSGRAVTEVTVDGKQMRVTYDVLSGLGRFK